jgi:hypothetical protein
MRGFGRRLVNTHSRETNADWQSMVNARSMMSTPLPTVGDAAERRAGDAVGLWHHGIGVVGYRRNVGAEPPAHHVLHEHLVTLRGPLRIDRLAVSAATDSQYR